MSMKNSLTPPGIEPATFGIVAQHLNHCATAVPLRWWYNNINSQLDATITNFIDNYNQLYIFRTIISPIIRSTRLCLQLMV